MTRPGGREPSSRFVSHVDESAMSRVRTGLDNFLEPDSERGGVARGSRIGLLAHPASVDAQARHAIERLVEANGLELVRLFAPEHGLFGEAQDMQPVDSATHAATGLPVSSLYGSDPSSLRPATEDLEGLDAIVCDVQDVGSRYYTFVYTVSYLMEAAREAGIPLVVLDRPNPIGGREVEGPVLDPALSSFVGRYPLPVRHGLTVGELSRLFNEEFGIGCELRVVPMSGWRRSMQFEDTGLCWTPPSPNMPGPDTARVYPGGCLIEGTNLSEGRGTTRPFEWFGAPWVDSMRLVRVLRDRALPGALFRAASFWPTFHKHSETTCHGVQVIVADRERFRPFATYLAALQEIRRQNPEAFDWRREPYEFEKDRLAIDLLLGRPELRPMLESDATLQELESSWAAALDRFVELRRRFLLYPD